MQPEDQRGSIVLQAVRVHNDDTGKRVDWIALSAVSQADRSAGRRRTLVRGRRVRGRWRGLSARTRTDLVGPRP